MLKFKRIGSVILVSAMLTGSVSGAAFAAETTAAEQTAVQTIVGFANANQEIAQITFTEGQTEAELTAQMPATVEAYLADGQTIELPVTWVCLGDDFTATDDFYYQFNAQWDANAYAADTVDALTGVPYVTASRTEAVSEGVMTRAANNNAVEIFTFLVKEMGLSAGAACGILANIEAESSFNPNCGGDGGTSYGILQWHNNRYTALRNWCGSNGYDYKTLEGQLRYLQFELSANNNAYLYNGKKIYDQMLTFDASAQGAYDAGYYWCYYYEVPANRGSKSVSRGNKAKNTYWPEFSTITVEEESAELAAFGSFTDVYANQWYCNAIQYVYEKGLMKGYSDTQFAPDEVLTRAQAAQVLKNMSDTEAKYALPIGSIVEFSDVNASEWFAGVIAWASSVGLVNGYGDGIFAPNEQVTREAFIQIMYNFVTKRGLDTSASASLDGFSDAGSVSDWSETAVKWAVANKILNGSDGALLPQGGVTRAQAAQIITNFVQAIGA